MKVYVQGRKVTLHPRNAIGKGGEADVYKLGRKLALKLFKTPDHPDFRPFPDQAQAAEARLDELQTKLRQFPDLGCREIVGPVDLATDRCGGRILGYTMPLVAGASPLSRFGDPRHRHDTDGTTVTAAFRNLHALVTSLHRRGIIIGDFNDLDVLVTGGTRVWLIDVDSYQLPGFVCRVFSERFLDPVLCDEQTGLVPARAFTEDSDWYAFSLMLFHSVLLTDAYGGIHKPADPPCSVGPPPGGRKVPPSKRRFRRLTVLHPDVKYPRPARPPEILPDDWLDHFDRLLHHDQRGPFPRHLLDSVAWTTCQACGLEHARRSCPRCPTRRATPPPPQVVIGQVRRTMIYECPEGRLLDVALIRGRPRWLVLAAGRILKDGGREVRVEVDDRTGSTSSGGRRQRRPAAGCGLLGDAVILAGGDRLEVIAAGGDTRCLDVDSTGGQPAWAVNSRHLFRVTGGRLVREEPLGPRLIGEVLAGQTRFWVGQAFGFGYYRAGRLSVAFVFEAGGVGLDDQVELPPIGGSWTSVSCRFGGDLCWLTVTADDGGRTVCHISVVARDGTVKATRRASVEEAAGAHRACAAGASLLVPTDQGIVRLGLAGDRIVETASFPDTEPFVDSASRLLAGAGGLYVVSERTIARLEITAGRP